MLSHPETLAALGCFETPTEDWPVANPFVTVPALLYLHAGDAVLVVADFHAADVRPSPARVATYRSYDFQRAPDPAGELRAALFAALDDAGLGERPIGVEARHLPHAVADWLRESGRAPVPATTSSHPRRRSRPSSELAAIRRASRLADVVQQAVKDHAAPGMSESELAGLAAAAMFREAGRRVPAILTVTAGAEATATGGGVATARRIEAGDLVLTDTSPWIDGGWSDTANAVLVGEPDRVTRQAVRRGPTRPRRRDRALPPGRGREGRRPAGARAARRARADVQPPHRASDRSRLVGRAADHAVLRRAARGRMVLALEPAIYLPGWGGIRLEHVFLVGADGNEILTKFEHTL